MFKSNNRYPGIRYDKRDKVWALYVKYYGEWRYLGREKSWWDAICLVKSYEHERDTAMEDGGVYLW